MDNLQLPTEILLRFGVRPEQSSVEFRGNNGGYSGARLWQVSSGDSQLFCLRRWPVGETYQRILFVHRILFFAAQQGFPPSLLPLPKRGENGPGKEGGSIQSDGRGFFYELCPWLGGAADFDSRPSIQRVQAAAETLARLHLALSGFPVQGRTKSILPGVQKRLAFIEELDAGLFLKISQIGGGDSFGGLGLRICESYLRLAPALKAELIEMSSQAFSQQVCLKDIWHDHLLFEGEKVSGVIDFGAIGFDNVATDVSRLFGSLFQNDQELWKIGLEAYRSIRELSEAEMKLIEVYDRSTTMLAGLNWLRWILVENRKFESIVPIVKRMEKLAHRLSDWIEVRNPSFKWNL